LQARVPLTYAIVIGTSTFKTSTAYCGFAELFHAASHDLGLLFCELDSLFVDSLFVSHEFQEERDVGSLTFATNSLDPGMLHVIDFRRIEWRVVEKNFYASAPSAIRRGTE